MTTRVDVLGSAIQFRGRRGEPIRRRNDRLLSAGGARRRRRGGRDGAWRDRYWGLWSRVHYSLVALAAVAVALVLAYWNLLWYQM